MAMSPVVFEACVDSVESAREAEEGGAARIELCTNFLEGGTTPSIGMVKIVESVVRIPVYCLIRPRGGDFVYSEKEINVMVEDIQAVASLGVRGVVFGMLTPEGDVDVLRMAPLVLLCKQLNLDMTYHRAFDMTRDPMRALEALISLGIPRVLTSGQHPLAIDGIPLIKTLVLSADGRIHIMAGSGINEVSAAEVVRKAGVKELHGSARVAKRTQANTTDNNPAIQSFGFGAKQDIMMTDRARVQAIIACATRAHLQSHLAVTQGVGRTRGSPPTPSSLDHARTITSNGYFVTESPSSNSNSSTAAERSLPYSRDNLQLDTSFALPTPAIVSPLQDIVVASAYAACHGYANGVPGPSEKTRAVVASSKPSERSRGVAANALLHVAQWGRSMSRGAAAADESDGDNCTSSSQWSGDGPDTEQLPGFRGRVRARSTSMGSDDFGDMASVEGPTAYAVRAAVKQTAVKSAVKALESSLRKADLKGSEHCPSDFDDFGGFVATDGCRRSPAFDESDIDILDGYAGGPESPFKQGDVFIRRGTLPGWAPPGGPTGSARRVDIGVVAKDESSRAASGAPPGLQPHTLQTSGAGNSNGGGHTWEREREREKSGTGSEGVGSRRVGNGTGSGMGYRGRPGSVPRNVVSPALRARSPMRWGGDLGLSGGGGGGSRVESERDGDVRAAERGVRTPVLNGSGGAADDGGYPRVAVPLSLEMNVPFKGGNMNGTSTFVLSGGPPKKVNSRRSSTPERSTSQNMRVAGSPGDGSYTTRMLELARDNALAAAMENQTLKMAREELESAWMSLARGVDKPALYTAVANDAKLEALKLRAMPINHNPHPDVRNGGEEKGVRRESEVGQQSMRRLGERTPVRTPIGSRDRTPNGRELTPTRGLKGTGVGVRDPTPTRTFSRFSSPLRSPGVYTLGKLVD